MPERASGLVFQEPPGTPAMEAALGSTSSLEPQALDGVVGPGFVAAFGSGAHVSLLFPWGKVFSLFWVV